MDTSEGIALIRWVTLRRLARRHSVCATLTSLCRRQEGRMIKAAAHDAYRRKRLVNCLFDIGAERYVVR
ncbi:hypothetical protein T02_4890 [Trichinella nativa]|uniref:Uncharacterized protein n=1 Tax=Trichinella nativa TaxID=6335 RepID=A0A0V1KJ03_9BILA|nr:hypothetical protein T02_4890 [Trichinella nativa]